MKFNIVAITGQESIAHACLICDDDHEVAGALLGKFNPFIRMYDILISSKALISGRVPSFYSLGLMDLGKILERDSSSIHNPNDPHNIVAPHQLWTAELDVFHVKILPARYQNVSFFLH